MKRFYYEAPAKVTECHKCGETCMCDVVVSDPEPETGYVDEYALCTDCKELESRRYING